MALRLKDIMKLPTMKSVRIAAGEDGMDRVVRWVHVMDIPQVTQWVQGGELLFITGIGLQSDPTTLTDLVKDMEMKNLAGLVVNLGPYIKEIPREVITLANDIDFPVLVVPWEVKLIDLTQAIGSAILMEQLEERSIWHLLEDILFAEFDSEENVINRARFHGYDLTSSCQIAILDIDDFKLFLKKREIYDEGEILEIKNRFRQVVLSVLTRSNEKVPSMLRSDSVILLLTRRGGKEKMDIDGMAAEIREAVTRQLPGLTVSMGLGSSYSDIRDLKKSLNEAELALKVQKSRGGKNNLCRYEDLGIYRLLFKIGKPEELDAFLREMLGGLMEYDCRYSTEFTKTLETYLHDGCNLAKTAENLHTHRNTLKYRLKRIGEILGADIHEASMRINLEVAFVIRSFIHIPN